MSNSSNRADALRDRLVRWLVEDFAELESDELYTALSGVVTSGGVGGGPVVQRFVTWARALISEEFSDLEPPTLNAVVGDVAKGVEVARRSGASSMGARSSSRSASQSAVGAPESASTGASSPAWTRPPVGGSSSRSVSASSSQLPAHGQDTGSQNPAVGGQSYIRTADYSCVQIWNLPAARLILTFDDKTELQVFAENLVRSNAEDFTLEPPPAEFTALSLELVAPGEVPIVAAAGAASVTDGNRVTVAVQHIPPTIRRLAAARRARLSSSHSVVRTNSQSESSHPNIRPSATPPPGVTPPPVSSRLGSEPDGPMAQAEPITARARSTSASVEWPLDAHAESGLGLDTAGTASRRRRRAAAVQTGRDADATNSRFKQPGLDHDPGRPSFGVQEEDEITRPPAPPTGRRPMETDGDAITQPPSGMTDVVAVSGAAPRVDGVEPGKPIATETGHGMDGGAAAALLRIAGRHPASIISIRTSVRTWILAIREDALMAIRTEPADPRFSARRAIALAGLVPEAELDEANRYAADNGEALRDVLAARRLLRQRQFESVDKARTTHMLEQLFDEPVEVWTAWAVDSFRRSPAPLSRFASAAWAHLVDRCEKRSNEEVERALSDRMLHRPCLDPASFLDPVSLGFAPQDRKFAFELCDGTTSVAQAVKASQLARRRAMSVVLSLDQAGLWKWQRVGAADSRIARSWDAIRAKSAAVARADHFELLGAHWSSDDKLIERAAEMTLRALDLDFVEENGSEEQKSTAANVRKAVLDARTFLLDPTNRATLRAGATHASERSAAVELYDKQAEIAIFRGDHSAAVESLRRVVELDPNHPTASAQLRQVLAELRR